MVSDMILPKAFIMNFCLAHVNSLMAKLPVLKVFILWNLNRVDG